MIAWLKKSLGAPDSSQDELTQGLAAYRQGDLQAACQVLERLTLKQPALAPAFKALADVYWDQGDTGRAQASYERAVEIQPTFAEALNNLGLLRRQMGSFAAAAETFRRALAAKPDLEAARINLADALEAQGDSQGAIACLEETLRINPSSIEARNNLGLAHAYLGHWTEAEKHYRICLEQDAASAKIWSNLALALRTQARTSESLDAALHAIECDPRDPALRSQYLLTTNYSDTLSADDVWSAHREFGEMHSRAESNYTQQSAPIANRKLRVGYVSADFGFHVVSFFLEPVLREHNHDRFEIFCYHNAVEDAQTQKLKTMVPHWRSVHGLDDATVIDMIRADRLDVLVDLSGHTGGNRLAVFAQRVALIQATWLGYPNTTGLANMDVRITDAQADPVGMTDHLHSEALVRLPNGFICYQPRAEAPAVAELPTLKNGCITFGCFNSPVKLTDVALRMWARLLQVVPNSRLLLKGKGLDTSSLAQSIRDRFVAAGGDAARLELRGDIRTFEGHLGAYNEVDIALDSFPYNGTTTTFEALWMGCPVITLAGDRHAARVGASILTRIGHPAWIAETPEQYVDIARALASDTHQLRSVRMKLRTELAQSPATDARLFTRSLEKAYVDWVAAATRDAGNAERVSSAPQIEIA